MSIFLTDGRMFLGPYQPLREPFAVAHGARFLRQAHGATDVYSVRADTDDQARRAWRSSRKGGR